MTTLMSRWQPLEMLDKHFEVCECWQG